MHRSLHAGHRENYTQSVTDRTRKRDTLAKRKDVSRLFNHWLPSKSTLTKANTVDFGWVLWKTQKTATFSQKAKNYHLDVSWTGEETSKATALISSLRDDTSLLSETDWLIEQQIARYFSRLSTVTKIGLLTRSPSVDMNEDEEADPMPMI